MNKPITLCDRCDNAFHCLLNYDGKPCRKNRTVEPTNADRIRAMTDDELTRFFAENCGCDEWCMHKRSGACASKSENECCLDVWYRWLKSPADKEGEG